MKVLDRFWWLIGLLSVIWIVQILNVITGYTLNTWFGLIPRTLGGLDGVVLMPALHGSFAHAAANTAPMLILGGLLAATARPVALVATALIVVLGGAGVWLLGKSAIHIGASGLVFGWFGFLVTRGLVEKQAIPLLVAIGVAVVYGAMLWGALPGQAGISWESHLFGALAGIATAYLLRGQGRQDDIIR